jgi:tRNA-2-methylthio-N6-dimethylallyladenosine synthase
MNLYIKTFGCQMNVYDSEKMADVLKHSHQIKLVEKAEQADILLLNTCSIREKAQEKLFHQLGRWKKLKDKNKDLIIGVGGCVASQEGELIFKRAHYVDMIFGPQTLHRLPNLLNNVLKKQDQDISRQIDISFPEIEKFDYLPKAQTTKVTAFVSIMEGCSKYCSFCVVPYTRGEEVSRPFNDIIDEIKVLAEQGVKEINLLGQNVNAYRGELENEMVDLALLIYFVSKIEGIKRIRYTTSHPVEFSNSLIEIYKEVPELVSHIHLPVQSGSDKILSMMKRGHNVLEYKEKLRKLKKIRPDISFSSDFIIGFPGENDTDFQQTIDLIKSISFDKSFSFIYSARPGTPAADLADDVSLEVKKERLKQVQTLLLNSEAKIANKMIGSIQEVLVENRTQKTKNLFSRTQNNKSVYFQGSDELIGQLVKVKITQSNNNALLAELV